MRHVDPDLKEKGKQVVREGKQKAKASSAPEVKKTQRGRSAGAANYTTEDIWGLLAILAERLPISGKAWNNCRDKFNVWAEENERPVRTAKSLKVKFKQVFFSFCFLFCDPTDFLFFCTVGEGQEAHR